MKNNKVTYHYIAPTSDIGNIEKKQETLQFNIKKPVMHVIY